MIIDGPQELTLAQKKERVKKRIGKMFLHMKQEVSKFDTAIDEMIDNNQAGLTRQEVLSVFDSSTQAELNSIRQDLKDAVVNITTQ